MKQFYKSLSASAWFAGALLMLLPFTGKAALSGTYTIDPTAAASSTNYKNFSSAIGDLLNGNRSSTPTGCGGATMDGGTANGAGVSGPVKFLVKNSTNGTKVTFAEYIKITAVTGTSATNTITFQGVGLNGSGVTDSSMVEIAYASNSYVVYLGSLSASLGANNIIFKKIRIVTTYSAGCAVQIDGVNSTSAGSNNNQFWHCQMIGYTSATTTATQSVVYMNASSSGRIDTGNVFRGNLVQYGSNAFYIYGYTTSSSYFQRNTTIDSNQIKNCYYYGVNASQAGDRLKITNNTFTSICTNSGYYGIYTNYVMSPTIKGNIMTSWTTTTPGAAIYTQYASPSNIQTNAATIISHNTILSPSAGFSAGQGAIMTYYPYTGMTSANANQPCIITNNMITIAGGTNQNYGLYTYYGTNTIIAYNSIHIANTSTSSYAIYDYCPTTNIQQIFRNNIVNILGGYVYYYQISSTPSLNYNNIRTTGANFGYWSSYGTSSSFAAWKTNTGQDANSTNLTPSFTNTTTGDLHISPAQSGLIAGSPITSTLPAVTGVTGVDYDYSNRSGTTPCIGADEFAMYSLDAGISAINPTSLLFCSSTSQAVTATLTNFGSTTLTSATINWKINGTSQTAINWTGSLAFNGTTTINLSTVSLTAGANNVIWAGTTSPNGGSDLNVVNDSLNKNYTSGMSGTYTIDPAGSGSTNFTTFTAAVTALAGGACGPVVFNVAAGTYTEQININSFLGASNTNRVRFQGAGDSTQVVLTSAAAYTLRLNGGSYISFWRMTIRNTGTTGNPVQIQNGSSNDSFSKCQIIGYNGANTATTNALVLHTAPASAATMGNNNIFRNTYFQYGSYGIYYSGMTTSPATALTTASGIQILNNVFSNQYYMGVYAGYIGLTGTTNQISSNIFSASTSYTGYYGVYSIGNMNGFHITKNKITGIQGGYGIYIQNSNYGISSSGNTANTISNNFIQVGTTTTAYGIYITSNSYATGIYFNSINNTSSSASTSNVCFYSAIGNGCGNNNYVTNNIFSNTGNGSSAGYATYISNFLSGSTVCFINVIDYNAYYVGTGAVALAYVNPTTYTTFASLKSAMAGYSCDQNSVSGLPYFTSSTDLHANNPSFRAGQSMNPQYGVTITTDIDNQSRATTPCIGADEFPAYSLDAGITSLNVGTLPLCAGTAAVNAVIKNYGSTTLTSATIDWTINAVSQTAINWTGSLALGASTSVVLTSSHTFASGTTYAFTATTSLPNGGTDLFTSNDGGSGSFGQGMSGTYTIDPAGSGSTNFTSFTSAVTALNSNGLCGAVTFNVASGTYTEQVALGTILGASATNTVTFQGQSDSSLVVVTKSNSTAASNYIFKFDGTSYVTLKKLTLSATNASYSTCLWYVNGANNITVKNGRLLGYSGSVTSSNNAIVFMPSPSSASMNYTNCTFDGNNIQNGSMAFYCFGYTNTSGSNLGGLNIKNNIISNQYYSFIYTQYTEALQLTNNNMTTTSSYTGFYGVYLYYNQNGTLISRNKIIATSANGYGIYNQWSNYSGGGTQGVIANNFIAFGSNSTNTSYGIYNYYALSQTYEFNSVNMSGTGTTNTYPMYFTPNTTGGIAVSFIRNNIFANSSSGASGGLCFYFQGTSYVAASGVQNNCYFSTLLGTGSLLNYNGTTMSYATWKASYVTTDQNSQNGNPGFTSSSDLHSSYSGTGATYLAAKGLAGTGYTTDIDGNSRISPPCIGADEFFNSSLDAAVTSISGLSAGTNPVYATITNVSTTTLTSLTIHLRVGASYPQTTVSVTSWTGSLATGQSALVNLGGGQTWTAGTSYTIAVHSYSPNGSTDANANNDSIKQAMVAGMSGVYTINPSGSGSRNFTTFNLAKTALTGTGGVTGPVQFNVSNGTYNEQLALSAITGASATNRIRFVSVSGDSNACQLSNSGTYTLQYTGVNYVTFQEIGIINTSTYGLYMPASYTNTNDSFVNCQFKGPSYCAYFNPNSTSYTLSNIVFQQNSFINGSYGVYFNGTSSSGLTTTVTFLRNTFLNQTAYAAFFQYADGIWFNYNNITSNSTSINYGLYAYWWMCNGRGNQVIGNKINLTSSTTTCYGMYVYYMGVNYSVYSTIANNSIIAGSTSDASATYGYYHQYPYYNYVYNNTFVAQGTNASSAGVYVYNSSGGGTSYWKNNIFANLGNGSTTYGTAAWAYGTNANGYFTADYNDYYVYGSANIGSLNGSAVSTLAAWRTAIGGTSDLNSTNQNPSFSSVPSNLGINNLCLTGVSGLGITTDQNGTTRNSPPSMGAYEASGGVANDMGVSAITAPVAPFAPGVQSVAATIKNFGNNALTSGTIKWYVNNVLQGTTTLSSTLSTCGTTSISLGNYTFSAGTSYTIKVKTSLPNGGTDGNLTNDSLQMTACPALSGVYTINPSGSGSTNFTTFAAAVGAMTCGGIVGPVTFNVSNGTYNEQIVVPVISGASAVNRVTFKGLNNDSSLVTLSYSSSLSTANYTLSIAAANYITFKKMTIQGLGSTYGTAVDFRGFPSNDSIANCRLIGYSTTSTGSNLAVIFGNCPSTPVVNFYIYNNFIKDGAMGIYWQGQSSPNTDQYTITYNTFSNQYYAGIYSQYQGGLYFNYNTITSNTTYTSYYGAYIYYCPAGSRGCQIMNNKVYGSMTGYGMYIYYFGVNNSTVSTVANNLVQMGSTTSSVATYGMYNQYPWYDNFYHNTCVVYGTSTSNAAFYTYNNSGSSISNYRNNIFANLGNGTTGFGYGMFILSTASNYISYDYNDIYVLSGGNIGSCNGTTYSSLSAWKTAVASNDANTLSSNPIFTSAPTDLHIGDGCLLGTTGLGITTDYAGTTRNSPPTMGAYEASSTTTNDLGITAVTSPTSPVTAGSQNVVVTLRNYGTNTVTTANITYSINGSSPVTLAWSGSLATCGTTSITFTGANQYNFSGGRYSVKAWSSDPNGVTETGTKRANDTLNSSLCGFMSGTFTINPSAANIGTNFTTFAAAVSQLNCTGINGPVVFNVSNGVYSEQISIGTITGISSTNTVRFQSLSGDSSLVTLDYPSSTLSTNNYTLQLANAKWITFRKMTISRSGGNTYGTALYLNAIGSAGPQGSINNTFSHCRFMGQVTTSTGSNLATINFVNGGSYNDTGNVFRGCYIYGGSMGIYAQGRSNTVAASDWGTQIDSCKFTGQYYMGIYSYYQDRMRITNNLFDNTIGYGTGGYGIYCYYNNAPYIVGNTMQNFTATPYIAIGTFYSGATTTNTVNALRICNNKIYISNGMYGGSYGAITVYYSYSGSGVPVAPTSTQPNVIANNMVSVAGSTYTTYGIYDYYNYYTYYLYNSINITATTTASAGMYIYPYPASTALVLLNNCINNTGGGYAMQVPTNVSYVTSMDNNNYRATGTNIGGWNGSNYTTLANWKSGTGKDASSINYDPLYYAFNNLHALNSNLPSGTTTTASTYVTKDIDGQSRPLGTLPCIGADEFIPVGYDASITTINNTSYCSGSQNMSVTLKNFGVVTLTSANIDWTINSNPQATYNWTGSLTQGQSTTLTLGTFTPTSGTYALTATSSSPNGNTDGNPSNDGASKSIIQGLSGTYTINPSGSGSTNFTTFAAAFAALNNAGLCGGVLFNVSSGTYTEQVTLNSIAGANASNRVRFVSVGNDSSLVTLTSSGTTLTLNGASYVTFKKMTIQSTTGYAINMMTIPTNDSISSCRLVGLYGTSTGTGQAVVYQVGAAPVNITFYNNVILNGSYGIYWNTNNSNGHTEGTNIIHNQFTNQYYMGFYSNYCDGTYFNQNVITTNSYNATYYGAYFNWTTALTRAVSTQENRIYGNMTGYGMYFYYQGVNSSAATTIANNMIQMGNTSSGSTTYGMYVTNNYTLYCYHNTVVVYGTSTSNYAMYNGATLTNSVGISSYRNNIWANLGNGTSSFGAPFYTQNLTNPTFDYNDLYMLSGGNIGNYNGTLYTTLAAWKLAVSTNDANSISTNPTFTSSSDLHASNQGLRAAVTGTGITTDIDGTLRSVTSPVIGADEFPAPNLDAAITGINTGIQTCVGSQNVVVTLKNNGLTTLTSALIDWTINSSPQTQYSWTGSLTSGQTSAVTVGTNTYAANTPYALTATVSSPNGGTDGFSGNDLYSGTYQAGLTGTYTINPSGSGSTNFTTFAAATAALSYGVCGPVTFNVSSGTYNERLIIAGAIAGSSSTNRVTFQAASGDSSTVTLSYPSDGVLTGTVDFNGASYVTVRKMTILRSGGASTYGMAVYIRGGTNNCIFTHCRLTGPTTTSNTSNLSTVYSSTDNDNYNTFRNNLISNNAYGFYWNGVTTTYEQGTIIDSNTITGMYYYGIYIQNQGYELIQKNLIQNFGISNAGVGIYDYYSRYGSRINGNTILGPNGLTYGIYNYYNNQPAGGAGPNSSVTNNMVSIGGTVLSYGIYQYYNYLPPTKVAFNSVLMTNTNTSSAGIHIYDPYTPADSVFNNSSYNSGGGYAIYVSTTPSVSYMNYNNWAVTGTNLGYWNGTNCTSMANWRTTSGWDANSQNGNPGYVSSTDLHSSYSGTGATYLFAKGLAAAAPVTTDIDGNSRQTLPCIGADEFYSPSLNAGVVAITNPTSPLSFGTQNVNATISNLSATTLTSLDLQFRIGGVGSAIYNWTGSLLSGQQTTVTVGSYNFSTGVTIVVHGYNPNGGTDVDASNDSFTKILCTPLSGTYTINPAGSGPSNYTSFTAAANALTCGGVTGPVIFNVSNGGYNEQINLTGIPGISATNTVTFKGLNNNAALDTIRTTNTGATIYLGSSYIRLKYMTILNLNTTVSSTTANFAIQVGTSSNDSIVNCTVAGTTSWPYNTGYYDNGNLNSNNVIKNSFVYGNYQGIYWVSSAITASGNKLIKNIIGGGAYPFTVQNQTGFEMDSNAMSDYGSWGGGTFFNMNSMAGATKVTRNTFLFTSASQRSTFMNLTNCNGVSGTPGLFANNFISDYCNYNTHSTLNLSGITYFNFYHNTILDGNTDNSTAYASLYANIASGGTVNIKNNIIRNVGGGYAIYNANATVNQNYNNIYTSGSNLGYFGTTATTYSTLTAWKAGTGLDANSQNINVPFVSQTDLHLTAACSSPKGTGGLQTYDIDNNTRHATLPFMGADEFYTAPYDLSGIVISAPTNPVGAGPYDVTVKLVNTGSVTLTAADVSYAVNGGTPVVQSLTSLTLNPCDSLIVNFTSTSGPGSTDQRVTFGTGLNIMKAYGTNLDLTNNDQNNINDTAVGYFCSPYAAGTITIDPSSSYSSTNFHTFNEALLALNNCGISGAQVVQVSNGTYNEQLNISGITGISATNTVTFESASGDSSQVVLSSPSSSLATNNYVINLNGADFLTFKKMTITRTGTNQYARVINYGGGAHNNRFLNNRIIGVQATNAGNPPSSDKIVVYSAGDNDTSNWFMNNVVKFGECSFWLNGVSSVSLERGLIISGNQIDSGVYAAIYNRYMDAPVYNNNSMTLPYSTTNYAYAMRLESNNNAMVIRNNKVWNYASGLFNRGIYPVNCIGTVGTPIIIANNMILVSGGASTSTSSVSIAGSNYVNFYNNTLVCGGTNTTTAGALDFSGAGTPIGYNFQNNIVANVGTGRALNIPSGYTSQIGTMDNNTYYAASGSIGVFGGTTVTTIASLRTTSGKDASSIYVNPMFTSSTDLHTNNCLAKNRGAVLASVTTDIDGGSRDATPDAGADEMSGIAGNWIGYTNGSWSTATNWCDGVEPSCGGATVVNIPNLSTLSGVTTYYPSIAGDTAYALDVNIASGASATVGLDGRIDACGHITNTGTLTMTNNAKLVTDDLTFASGSSVSTASTSSIVSTGMFTNNLASFTNVAKDTFNDVQNNASKVITVAPGGSFFVNGMLTNDGTVNVNSNAWTTDVDNNGTFTVANGKTWYLAGDMTSGGTLTENGLLDINGTGPQSFDGASIDSVKVSGTGVKTLTSDLTIQHSLNFTTTNGQIVTGSNAITLDTTAVLIENDTNMVLGQIQMLNKWMPVSTSSSFGGLGVSITSSATAPLGHVDVVRFTGSGAARTGQTGASGIDRYFDITPEFNSQLGATLTLRYNDFASELNGISETDLALYRSGDGGVTWEMLNTNITFSPSLDQVTKTNVDHFSQWTFGDNINQLPVELTKFNANMLDAKTVTLDFTTASELNNDHFDIERSVDGVNFTKVGEVVGNGTTAQEHNYNYIDNNVDLLLVPTLYYRLKQVDYNGEFTYSVIRNVNLNSLNVKGVKVWYSDAEQKMNVVVSSNVSDNIVIKMIDMHGKVLTQKNVSASVGVNQYSILTSDVAKGVYDIVITKGDGTVTKRVMKY